MRPSALERAAATDPDGQTETRDPSVAGAGVGVGAGVVEHVRDQLDDRLFLLRFAHRRHERDRCQRIRGHDISAVVALQGVIYAEVIGEQSHGAAIVPVGEWVVLHDEVVQVCRCC